MNVKKAKGAEGGNVSRCTSRPAQAVTVTLPGNQLLIRYVVTSPVHTVTIWCYGKR
jgi:hypothetical protein